MPETTILVDGRRVPADECHNLYYALTKCPEVTDIGPYWAVVCRCCEGYGVHSWSPSSYYNGASGPDSGEYSCTRCAGAGEFKVVVP